VVSPETRQFPIRDVDARLLEPIDRPMPVGQRGAHAGMAHSTAHLFFSGAALTQRDIAGSRYCADGLAVPPNRCWRRCRRALCAESSKSHPTPLSQEGCEMEQILRFFDLAPVPAVAAAIDPVTAATAGIEGPS
jgi:hypothetical protein